MYKTIESTQPNLTIVTELTAVSAIGFLEQTKVDQGGSEQSGNEDHYCSTPFAAG
jgi:hypothetical protein